MMMTEADIKRNDETIEIIAYLAREAIVKEVKAYVFFLFECR